VAAKVASVILPLYLKDIVDGLSMPATVLVLPVAALLGYGFARLASSVFGELRDALFARVTQGSIRRIAAQMFKHLFALSLRFHMQQQNGGRSRDIDCGNTCIGVLLNSLVCNILLTLLDIGVEASILQLRYDWPFAVVTLGTIAARVALTLLVTEKRMV